MKRKVAIPLIVVAVALMFAGRHRLHAWLFGESEQEHTTRVLDHDRDVLLSKKGDEQEVFGALVRLGDRRNPLSKTAAIEKLNDASETVRKGAAEALGYFYAEPDARAALDKIFGDKSEDVRVTAFRALSNRAGGAERVQTLHKLASESGRRSDLEKAAIYRGLLRLGQNDEKSKAADVLIGLYEKSPDSRTKFSAMTELMSNLPRDPRVIELVKKDAMNSSNPLIQSQAVRFAAGVREKSLLSEFKKLAQSQQIAVRMAVIQSLAIGCPDDRYEILEGVIKKEDNPDVRNQAYEQLKIMGGHQAHNLLQSAIAGKSVRETEAVLAQESLKAAEKNSRQPDRCQP